MTGNNTIKKPLTFETLYQKFNDRGQLVFSDEIVLAEEIKAGAFTPSITEIKVMQNFSSPALFVTVSDARTGREEAGEAFYYNEYKNSMKQTLRAAIYTYVPLHMK